MQIGETLASAYAEEYQKENVKKYLMQRKEIIYLPESCTEEMAKAVVAVNEKYGFRSVLLPKSNRDRSFKIGVDYSNKRKSR